MAPACTSSFGLWIRSCSPAPVNATDGPASSRSCRLRGRSTRSNLTSRPRLAPSAGSNSKNGRIVSQITCGEPVTTKDLLELYGEMIRTPFRTVLQILTGAERCEPCPVCGNHALSRAQHGRKRDGCGTVSVEQLFGLVPRQERRQGGPRPCPLEPKMTVQRHRQSAARGPPTGEMAVRPARESSRSSPGLTPQGLFLAPAENVLVNARQLLAESRRVYIYGDSIVMSVGEDTNGHLVTLLVDHHLESAAPGLMANIFLCESGGDDDEREPLEFAAPRGFLSQLFESFPIDLDSAAHWHLRQATDFRRAVCAVRSRLASRVEDTGSRS